MKVLIIEDDFQVLALLKRIFQDRGCDVITYSNPRLCPVNELSCPCPMHPDCPDMILTDLDMPTENGLEFLNRLERKNCQCRHVALMSGKSLPEKESLRLAESGRHFFPKPFDLQRIYEWIDGAARPQPGS
jgi:DNA-binding response OmpR family regulator